MIEVEIQCDASQGMELVRELRDRGLVQGRDFDFAYHPYTYNNFTGEHAYRRMVFAFYKDKYGTFYSLKWSNNEQ